jgi:N-carbamoylputrescine amidase
VSAHVEGSYRVALVQMACGPDPDENVAKAEARVIEAARAGAALVCLPELFRSQYFCQREDHAFFELAEPIPGPTTERFAAVAREHHIAIIVPIFERRAPGLYHNSAAVLDRTGELVGRYRKMHIPDDPLYYEKFYFAPGDLGFPSFPLSVGRIGVLICWDQWYPEAARLAALAGGELLVYPTAIGWHPHEKEEHGGAQYDAWQTMQRAHAIANGVFVAVPNRVGHEDGNVRGHRTDGPGIEFWGGSFVADPFGRVLVQGSHDREELLYATVEPREIATTRQYWPFLRDRRIDAYSGLAERYRDRS